MVGGGSMSAGRLVVDTLSDARKAPPTLRAQTKAPLDCTGGPSASPKLRQASRSKRAAAGHTVCSPSNCYKTPSREISAHCLADSCHFSSQPSSAQKASSMSPLIDSQINTIARRAPKSVCRLLTRRHFSDRPSGRPINQSIARQTATNSS